MVQLGIFRYSSIYMKGVPGSQFVYVQVNAASNHWFADIESLVDRTLVTARGDETSSN